MNAGISNRRPFPSGASHDMGLFCIQASATIQTQINKTIRICIVGPIYKQSKSHQNAIAPFTPSRRLRRRLFVLFFFFFIDFLGLVSRSERAKDMLIVSCVSMWFRWSRDSESSQGGVREKGKRARMIDRTCFLSQQSINPKDKHTVKKCRSIGEGANWCLITTKKKDIELRCSIKLYS